jgi:6-phosphogluconolactonase
MIKDVDIRKFHPAEWPLQAAGLIQNTINDAINKQGRCSVMLTGGRSAERLYTSWADLPAFGRNARVQFYFGDERCVPPDNKESNFGLAMRTLFKRGVPPGCSVIRMKVETSNCDVAALNYDSQLPKQIDILLLGVGEDGHIASLFPGSAALKITDHQVVAIKSPKPPHGRLTITPPVISRAKSVFVLASGSSKGQVLDKALQAEGDAHKVPASLVLNAIWLLESAIPENFPRSITREI